MKALSIAKVDYLSMYIANNHLCEVPFERRLIYALNMNLRYPEQDERGYGHLRTISLVTKGAKLGSIQLMECTINYNGAVYHLSAHNARALYKQACSLARHLENTDGIMTIQDYINYWSLSYITVPDVPDFKIYNHTHPQKSGVVVQFHDLTIMAMS